MRNTKFNYVPELNMKVSAAFERNLENLKKDVNLLERNIPEYIRIEPDVKESVEVFTINIALFREKTALVKSTIDLMEKNMKNIRRTPDEFRALRKDLALLKPKLKEIETQLEFNSAIFFGSGFYVSYFGAGGFYEKEVERARIYAEEVKKEEERRQRKFAKWLAGDKD